MRFVLLFVLISSGLVALYDYPYSERSVFVARVFVPYFLAYARAAGAVLALFDPTVIVTGLQVGGRFSLVVARGCDAGEAMLLLTSAIVTFPVAWPRRIVGLMIGVPVVFLLNVMRICALYFIGMNVPHLFRVSHQDVFPALILLLATIVFVVWARWAQARSRQDQKALE